MAHDIDSRNLFLSAASKKYGPIFLAFSIGILHFNSELSLAEQSLPLTPPPLHRVYASGLALREEASATAKVITYVPYGVPVQLLSQPPGASAKWTRVKIESGENQVEGFLARDKIGVEAQQPPLSEQQKMASSKKEVLILQFNCITPEEAARKAKTYGGVAYGSAAAPLAKQGCQPISQDEEFQFYPKAETFQSIREYWERVAWWNPESFGPGRSVLLKVMLDAESPYSKTPRWLLTLSPAFYSSFELRKTAPLDSSQTAVIEKTAKQLGEMDPSLPKIKISYFRSPAMTFASLKNESPPPPVLRDLSLLRSEVIAQKPFEKIKIPAGEIFKIFIDLTTGDAKKTTLRRLYSPSFPYGYYFERASGRPQLPSSTQFPGKWRWAREASYFIDANFEWPKPEAGKVKFLNQPKRTADGSDTFGQEQFTIDFNADNIADWYSICQSKGSFDNEDGSEGGPIYGCDDWINIDGKWEFLGARTSL